jgi:hypothetical protein
MHASKVRLQLLALVAALGCTHDFDKFSSPDVPDQGGNGGNAAGVGAVGGLLGSAGAVGSAGVFGTAGDSGSAGTAGSAGSAGGACPTGQKRCGMDCVSNDDPATGCAAPSCDACSTANSLHACQNGACATNCAIGFGDCGGGAADGCEQVLTDVHHCGSCGNDCARQGAAGGLTCESQRCGCASDDQCRVGQGPGTATCNTANRTCVCDATECRSGEACERDGNSRHCRCNGQNACGADETCCSAPAGCKNLTNDTANCGACGAVCAAGFKCQQGACACDADADCNAGSMGTCVTDPACNTSPCGPNRCSCGGSVCAPGQRCFPGDRCG